MFNPFSKLVNPRLPAAAIGLESDNATVVSLERRGRSGYTLRTAAHVTLPPGLVHPSFDSPNIANPDELVNTLAELVSSAKLERRGKWSVALPGAATRSTIVPLENAPASRTELEEVLRWKIERSFGASVDELQIARRRLPPDESGHQRYLACGVRLSVLSEYEGVFEALGWQAGLIVPRYMGEAHWLMNRAERASGNALLVSSHDEGFTAVLVRKGHPAFVRGVACGPQDLADELYRMLLYYRDRKLGAEEARESLTITDLLVIGGGFSETEVSRSIGETLGSEPRLLRAAELGIMLPSSDLNFATLAAPAGLAALAWS